MCFCIATLDRLGFLQQNSLSASICNCQFKEAQVNLPLEQSAPVVIKIIAVAHDANRYDEMRVESAAIFQDLSRDNLPQLHDKVCLVEKIILTIVVEINHHRVRRLSLIVRHALMEVEESIELSTKRCI